MNRLLRISLSLVVCLSLSGLASAATYTWDGADDVSGLPAADTSFATGANWVGDVAPTVFDASTTLIFGNGGSVADHTLALPNPITDWVTMTVGQLSFSRIGGFTLTNTGAGTGMAETRFAITPQSLSVTEPYEYTINSAAAGNYMRLVPAEGPTTWSIVTGGKLSTGRIYTYTTTDLTVTGGGTLEMSGWLNRIPGLTITANTTVSTLSGNIAVESGKFFLESGSKITAKAGVSNLVIGIGSATSTGVGIIEGEVYSPQGFNHAGFGELVIRGSGRIVDAGGGSTVNNLYGTIVFDNTGTNLADRWEDTAGVRPQDGFMNLIYRGSSTAESSETFAQIRAEGLYSKLDIRHGEGQNAIFTASELMVISNHNMFLLTGNDFAATSGPGSFVKVTATPVRTNGIMDARIQVEGDFVMWNSTSKVVSAYSEATRPSVIGATVTQNVQLAGSQTLAAAGLVNSLKVSGTNGPVALDLGGAGKGLTINTGGLIVINEDVTISNGGLSMSGKGFLAIQNVSDLTIGSDVVLTNTAGNLGIVTKAGAGHLTVNANLTHATSRTFYIYDGSFQYGGSQDVSVNAGGNRSEDARIVMAGTGIMTLAASNNARYSATAVDVLSGTVAVGSNGTLGAGSSIDIAGGAKFWSAADHTQTKVAIGGAGTIMMDSLIAGGGTVRKLTSNGGSFAPAGLMTVVGNLTLGQSGTTNASLSLDVAGSNGVAGTDFDQLAVTGAVVGLDKAALVVKVAGGLDLAGDVLSIITTSSDLSAAPQFASVTVNGGAMLADVTYGVGVVSLGNFRLTFKMGDADGDTFVDDDDLSLLLSNWKGGEVGWAKGDFNFSGDVDDDDLSLLLSNWTGSGGGTIPEPATIGLLILGGMGLIRRRR